MFSIEKHLYLIPDNCNSFVPYGRVPRVILRYFLISSSISLSEMKNTPNKWSYYTIFPCTFCGVNINFYIIFFNFLPWTLDLFLLFDVRPLQSDTYAQKKTAVSTRPRFKIEAPEVSRFHEQERTGTDLYSGPLYHRIFVNLRRRLSRHDHHLYGILSSISKMCKRLNMKNRRAKYYTMNIHSLEWEAQACSIFIWIIYRIAKWMYWRIYSLFYDVYKKILQHIFIVCSPPEL